MFFLFGLIIGSFLNVCIHRIPKGESIAYPPSHCPKCGHALRWYELMPVLSYLIQLGKCRQCAKHISMRYPLVELLTGLLFALAHLRYGYSLTLARHLVMTCLLIVITFVDLDHLRIPDVLSLGGLAVFALWQVFVPWQAWVNALLGLVISGGFLLLLAIISKGGMGGGDIKLAALLGFYFGWPMVLMILGIAFVCGAFIGVTLIVVGIKKRKDVIPFGPFLALGALMMLLAENYLLNLMGGYWL